MRSSAEARIPACGGRRQQDRRGCSTPWSGHACADAPPAQTRQRRRGRESPASAESAGETRRLVVVQTESLLVVDCVVARLPLHQGQQRGLPCSTVQAHRSAACVSVAVSVPLRRFRRLEGFCVPARRDAITPVPHRAGDGRSIRGFPYRNSHGFGLPPKPRCLQARLTRRPARPLSRHAPASCQRQRAGGPANRRAITAVLRATNKTLPKEVVVSCR